MAEGALESRRRPLNVPMDRFGRVFKLPVYVIHHLRRVARSHVITQCARPAPHGKTLSDNLTETARAAQYQRILSNKRRVREMNTQRGQGRLRDRRRSDDTFDNALHAPRDRHCHKAKPRFICYDAIVDVRVCIVGIQKRDIETDKRRMAPGHSIPTSRLNPAINPHWSGSKPASPAKSASGQNRDTPKRPAAVASAASSSSRQTRAMSSLTGSASNVRSGPSVVSNIRWHSGPTASADHSPPSGPIAGDLKTSVRANTDRRSELGADVSKTGDLRRAARRQDKAQRTDNMPCATRPPNINRRAAIRST